MGHIFLHHLEGGCSIQLSYERTTVDCQPLPTQYARHRVEGKLIRCGRASVCDLVSWLLLAGGMGGMRVFGGIPPYAG